ncbi:hypothetical protein TNCV_1860592 [Trichonephila clavipes]|nr:hypothetical protein TNCV_1860592 [Trichonephila clavipes]
MSDVTHHMRLLGVHFHMEIYNSVEKANGNPDFVRQMTLENLSLIPYEALHIYTDDCKRDQGHTGIGVNIKISAFDLSLKYS